MGASRKSEVARSREKDSQERLGARIAELEVELQRKDQVARDARAELAEALEQQAATAEILRVICLSGAVGGTVSPGGR